MGIGYPVDFQKEDEERSRYEAEESVIASRKRNSTIDETKTMSRSEIAMYRLKT